jgi:prepilin-type processing-associated H-X9-DG protein
VIELVVVLAILGLLMTFLLPAVQQARESARLAQCTSRLHQIGLALAAFESSNGRYPGSMQFGSDSVSRVEYALSPQAQLLPFLDLMPLYNQIDPHEPGQGGTFYVLANIELIDTPVEAFVCPSDSVPAGGLNYRACHGTGPGEYGYAGFGDLSSSVFYGAFGVTGRTAAKFEDGLSTTAFFSERLVGDMDDSVYDPRRDVFFAGGWDFVTPADAIARCRLPSGADPDHESGVGGTWFIGRKNLTGYNHVLTPNSWQPDCVAGIKGTQPNTFVSGAMQAYGPTTARSNHTGGVNVLFGDGAVKFVSNSVDLAVWRAWASVDGHD